MTIVLGKVFHLEFPRMKHEENSPAGDHEAVATKCDSTDLDVQYNKTRWVRLRPTATAYNTHWEEPCVRDGFVDPLHLLPKRITVRRMNDAQVERLVAHTNGKVYHIEPMKRRMAHAASLGLKGRVEIKRDRRVTVAMLRELKADADAAGFVAVLATLDNWWGWRRLLRRARQAGWETRRLRA